MKYLRYSRKVRNSLSVDLLPSLLSPPLSLFLLVKYIRSLLSTGAHRRKGTTAVQQVIQVTRIYKHTGFKLYNYRDDIALLKLERPAKLSSKVNLACLPKSEAVVGDKCYVSGLSFNLRIRELNGKDIRDFSLYGILSIRDFIVYGILLYTGFYCIRDFSLYTGY